MKFGLAVLLLSSLAWGQSTTPNLGLTILPHGAPNWDTAMNVNWNLVDAGAIIKNPISDQTITGAHALTMSDLASTFTVKGSAAVGSLQLTNVATGTQCLHAGNTGLITGTGYDCGAASSAHSKCDQFAGATVDVKVNTCLLTTQVAGGGIADATALGGAQTIAAEIDVGSFAAPTLTAVAGAQFTAGTYRVITVIKPTVAVIAGYAILSQEASVTTSAGNLAIQVSSPPTVAGATQYDVYIGASGGGKWLELLCGAGPYTLGTPATVNTACSGAAVPTKFVPVQLWLPAIGTWTATMTDTVSNAIRWFHTSSIHGLDPGLGGPLEIATGASASLRSVCGSDPNPPANTGSGSTFLIEDFQCGNRSGGTVAQAAIEVTGSFDTATIRNMSGANYSGRGLFVHGTNSNTVGVCCGFSLSNSTFNGNSGANAVPCDIGETSSATSSVNFYNITCVHPGTGQPAFRINNPTWTTAINVYGLYMESYLAGSPCAGGDTSMVQLVNGGGSGDGGYTFFGAKMGSGCSGPASTSYLFSIASNVKAVMITNANTGSWGRGIIDNNTTPARTIGIGVAANSVIPFYQTGNKGAFQVGTGSPIHLTAQSGAIGAQSLCATTVCGPGTYNVQVTLTQNVLCTTSTNAQGPTAVQVSYTDDSGTATTQTYPLLGPNAMVPASLQAYIQGTGGLNGMVACGGGNAQCTALPNSAASEQQIRTNGATAITVATTHTACTTPGAYAYTLDATIAQVN